MHIVSDRGMDLSPEQSAGLDLHLVPLTITLDGKSYRSGVDIQPSEFYKLLAATPSFPTTSQPSSGDFAEIYRQLAATDPDILSIHISSGLSGTLSSAQQGAAMVPQARVTFYDTKTLSGAEGWHVEAAARAVKAGWPLQRILEMLQAISACSDTFFTLAELRYLIHGGRISHIKGLLGSILGIKPILGVDKVLGKYEQLGQARTMTQAVAKIVDVVAHRYPAGTELRAQVMHTANPDGADELHRQVAAKFKCTWLPVSSIAPVLGAHTGPTLVGLAFAPLAKYPQVP